MPDSYLHNHPEFSDLVRIVAEEQSINPILVEKNYWIMHCLYGLQQHGLKFELKGGTSLSKGFGIIDRFSEDIDIRIEPPEHLMVKANPNHQKPAHVKSRKDYYDWLANTIKIDGIEDVSRDLEFDDERYYRSGGIRLAYDNNTGNLSGLKDGILLEVGFDNVSPNSPQTISSWAYEFAVNKVEILDNRAIDVACYHPGYTFVEKLQTISTKFRLQQVEGSFPANFMRHYYDIYRLLEEPLVQEFIGTEAYTQHKEKRFPKADNQILSQNDAFLLDNPETRSTYEKAYTQSKALYYKSQPSFNLIMKTILSATKIKGI